MGRIMIWKILDVKSGPAEAGVHGVTRHTQYFALHLVKTYDYSKKKHNYIQISFSALFLT